MLWSPSFIVPGARGPLGAAHSLRKWVVLVSVSAAGCGTADSGDAGFVSQDGTAAGAEASTSADASESSTSTSGPLLDIGMETGSSNTDEGGQDGCAKVDFLFVIDNSGSMVEEQDNLAASFPGFINTIQQTLMAQDYQILVTDTDAASVGTSSVMIGSGTVQCEPDPTCCIGVCNGIGGTVIQPPPTQCNGSPCTDFPLPTGCEATIGSGRDYDQNGDACGITSGARYMLDTQADLTDTFACAALVGPNGDGLERPLDAVLAAIGTESEPGGCNEGFLRDDAILVVTFITDEDEGGSAGNAAAWKSALVSAKGGNEEALVVLGLIPDEGVAGGLCTETGDAPILRNFSESFVYGQWGSVCEPDYTQFFVDAVSSIDTACDGFVPPG